MVRLMSIQDLLSEEPPPALFKFSEHKGAEYVDIYWGGYEYSIELGQIDTPARLLGIVAHLAEKDWGDMTVDRTGRFVRALARRKGWDIW